MTGTDDSTRASPREAGGAEPADEAKTLAVGLGARSTGGEPEIVGHYRLEREIGRGGQGAVFLAEDLRLHRRVALKLLSAQTAASPAARLRFMREAEVASRLDHEAICTVFEAGEHEGALYIAMRYVDGAPLDALIRERRRRLEETGSRSSAVALLGHENESSGPRGEIDALLRFFEKLLRALQVAHEAGLVHRDVKPGNVMVTRSGEPVILDFGLARIEDDEGPALTRSDDQMGTPAYMSPEQISSRAHALDARTDVYSAAVGLYECLTLHRPHRAATREELYREILLRDPPDPRGFNPRIDADLRVVLDRALEKNPNRRYESAAAFADDLRALIERRPIAARPVTPFGRAWRFCRRRPALAGLIAVSILAAIVLAGLGAWITARQPLVEEARAEQERRRIDDELETAFLALDLGRRDAAMAAFRRAESDGRLAPEALAGLLRQLASDDDFAGVLRLAAENEETVRDRAGLAAVVAYARLRLAGKTDGEALEQIELADPRDAIDCFILSLREEADGERDVAGAFSRATDLMLQAVLRSGRPRALHHFRLVRMAGRARRLEVLGPAAGAICGRWADESAAWFSAGRAYIDAGSPDEAAPYLERAVALDPGFARARAALGIVQQARGDAAAARANFDRAAELDPEDALPHRLLAGLARASGNDAEEIGHLRQALELDPREDDAWFELGEALSRSGARAEAITAYRRAAAADPDYGPFHNRLAEALVAAGHPEEAIASMREGCRVALDLAVARLEVLDEAGWSVLPAVILEELHEREPARRNDELLGRLPLLRFLLRSGLGLGADATDLGEEARRDHRDRARRLLEELLDEWRGRAGGNAWDRVLLRRELRRLGDDPVFALVRPGALEGRLGPEEAALWAPLVAGLEALAPAR